MEEIGNEYLNSNFEYLASLDPPRVVPQLPRLPHGGGLLPNDFQIPTPEGAIGQNVLPSIILQVNEVEDVSLPIAMRLREIAPANGDLDAMYDETVEPGSLDETLRVLESKDVVTHHGRRQRLLRLGLTDGFMRVFAVEDCQRGCDALRNGVMWGAKLRLFAPLRVVNGVIILESKKTVLLGGFVKEIQSFWEKYAVKKLREMTGRPGLIAQAAASTNAAAPTDSTIHHGSDRTCTTAPAPPPQPQVEQGPCRVYPQQYPRNRMGPSLIPPNVATGAQAGPNLAPFMRSGSTAQTVTSVALPLKRNIAAPNPVRTVIGDVTGVESELVVARTVDGCGNEPLTFSLMVRLCERQSPASGNGDGASAEVIVDLGHAWLERAIGMDAASFQTLSSSSASDDQKQVESLVEKVGMAVELLGTAEFEIQRRPRDGELEVVSLRRLG